MVNWEQVINEMELPAFDDVFACDDPIRELYRRVGPERFRVELARMAIEAIRPGRLMELRPTLDNDML